MPKFLLFAFLLGFGSAFAAEGPYLYDLLKREPHRSAWNAMLAGRKGADPWLARYTATFDGVTIPAERVTVEGRSYLFTSVCQAHNCGSEGNTFYVLFAPDGRQAWGLYVSGGSRRTWFGDPDAPLRAVLTKRADEG